MNYPTTAVTANNATETNEIPTISIITNKQQFSVDTIDVSLESLRNEAINNNAHYNVGGRKAMIRLMSQVYQLWHDAKISGNFDVFMNNVRRKLKDLDVEVRSNSPDATQLIRYVFSGLTDEDFSDKQVHTYGRSLNVAFANIPRTKPEHFEKLIYGTPGGFDGLREQGKSTSAGTGTSRTSTRTASVALDIATKENTLDTIKADWPDKESFRIFIAVRNADGTTADLKDALLSNESKEATLLKFYDDRKKRLEPPKKVINSADKVALAQLVAKAANEKVKHLELEFQLKGAIASGTPEQCDQLRADVKSAKIQLDSLNASVKTMRAQLKQD